MRRRGAMDAEWSRGIHSTKCKGGKDRRAILPQRIADSLREQLRYAQALHREDVVAGHGAVSLPFVIAEKHRGAERGSRWEFVFPDPYPRRAARAG